MRSWSRPAVPDLPGTGPLPTLFDTASGRPRVTIPVDGRAGLYVCGITPYDATHLGHASTYLAFDTLVRLWLDAGLDVSYAQNTTDVDDPLLERATATGVDWRELAASQTDLFRSDMQHLAVIPPTDYVAVTDVVTDVADAVARLVESGFAYPVDTPDSAAGDDLYFDVTAAASSTTWHLGSTSRYDAPTMRRFFAERGGDPDRPGKRAPLDPLLWRSARAGEPSWPTTLGPGRPGWHIECTVIAHQHLATPITVNGGGSDLIFPHHEMSAGHGTALTGQPYAEQYAHTGMVAYQGEKMSKSLGNLVKVSELVAEGRDPRAIRLAIAAHHYRSDWEWFDDDLRGAEERLATWSTWASSVSAASAGADAGFVAELRLALSDDLDTPAAIGLVDALVEGGRPAGPLAVDAVQALLGIELIAR